MADSTVFRPSKLADVSLAYDDAVFVHPSQYDVIIGFTADDAEKKRGGALLTLTNMSAQGQQSHFFVKPSAKAELGTILMGSAHRGMGNFTLQDQVTISRFVRPESLPNMKWAEWQVDLVKSSEQPVHIDAKHLANYIRTEFSGHIFSVKQMLALKLPPFGPQTQSVGLKLHLRSFIPFSESDLASGAADAEPQVFGKAMMTANSDVQLLKTKGSALVFEGVAGEAKQLFEKDFNFQAMDIGGLDAEFREIFRKAFTSRMLPPDLVSRMGLPHIKGIMLFGPPGCGKTLIARQLAKALKAKEPKIVNGPEVLDKFVGAAEERIRDLFKDAEAEQAEKGDASDLHIIIFDEIDAICKKRGTISNGTGVHDSIVNQLLSKIDGVDSLNNILLIGMTNRLDMLDPALLRPGRFEVHMEIGLPDTFGRNQILTIHTKKLGENGMLADDVDIAALAEETENFTGAELQGVVKDARAYALAAVYDAETGKLDAGSVKVTQADFLQAVGAAQPAFGMKEDELELFVPHGIIPYSDKFDTLHSAMQRFMAQISAAGTLTPLLSVCLCGDAGSGKSALSAHLARNSSFAFVKRIGADMLVGQDQHTKVASITEVFLDAYKSPLSLIILDDIERLIEWVGIGPAFSNAVLQTLLVLLKRPPPKGHRLLVVGTTTRSMSTRLELDDSFSVTLDMPRLDSVGAFASVLQRFHMSQLDVAQAAAQLAESPGRLSLKKLLLVLEVAQQYQKAQDKEDGGEGKGDDSVAAAAAGAGGGDDEDADDVEEKRVPVGAAAFEQALLEVVGMV